MATRETSHCMPENAIIQQCIMKWQSYAPSNRYFVSYSSVYFVGLFHNPLQHIDTRKRKKYSNWCFSDTIFTILFLEMAHKSDDIMGAMASQITSLTIVYATVYSGADQRKHRNPASLAFVRGIHRWTVNSPHKRASNAENVSIDDDIMAFVFCLACRCNLLESTKNWQHVSVIQGCDMTIIRSNKSCYTYIPVYWKTHSLFFNMCQLLYPKSVQCFVIFFTHG